MWLLCYYSSAICPPHWIPLHRTIQVGRDFRSSLVLPAAQSKATCRVRTVDFEKPQIRRMHDLSGQPVALDCGNSIIYVQPPPPFSTCAPLFSTSHHAWLWTACTHVLYALMMLKGCSEVPQQHFLSTGWTKPPPSAPPHRASAPAPKHWGGLCWTCCGWPASILFRGLHTGCHSTVWMAEKSCLCWSSAQAPVRTAGRLLSLSTARMSHQLMPPALVLAVPQVPSSRITPQPGISQSLELQGALPPHLALHLSSWNSMKGSQHTVPEASSGPPKCQLFPPV